MCLHAHCAASTLPCRISAAPAHCISRCVHACTLCTWLDARGGVMTLLIPLLIHVTEYRIRTLTAAREHRHCTHSVVARCLHALHSAVHDSTFLLRL